MSTTTEPARNFHEWLSAIVKTAKQPESLSHHHVQTFLPVPSDGKLNGIDACHALLNTDWNKYTLADFDEHSSADKLLQPSEIADVVASESFWHSDQPFAGSLKASLVRMDFCETISALEIDRILCSCLAERISDDQQLITTFQRIMKIIGKNVQLANELYVQLLRRLRESEGFFIPERGLRLLAMTTLTLPCAQELRFPLHQQLCQICSQGVPYYLCETMTQMQTRLLRGAYPCPEALDIERFCTENITTCTVLLPDGEKDKIFYDSKLLLWQGLMQISRKHDLRDDNHFELFTADDQFLDGNQNMMKVLESSATNNGFTYLQVKRIFSTGIDENLDSRSLFWTYYQSRREYLQGWYPLTNTIATELCALQLCVLNGRRVLDKLTLEAIMICLPKQHAEDVDMDWPTAVHSSLQELKDITPNDARHRFVQRIEESSHGHCQFIPATTVRSSLANLSPSMDVIVGINRNGLHLFQRSPFVHILSIPVESYSNCSCTNTALTLRTNEMKDAKSLELQIKNGEQLQALAVVYGSELPRIQTTGIIEMNSESDIVPMSLKSNEKQAQETIEDQIPLDVENHPWTETGCIDVFSTPRLSSSTSVLAASEITTDENNVVLSPSLSKAESYEAAEKNRSAEQSTFLSDELQQFIPLTPPIHEGTSIDSLTKLEALTTGMEFQGEFFIEAMDIYHPLIRYARVKASDEKVFLKFYESVELFEHAKTMHGALLNETYVCRVNEFLKECDGYPPCIVFERGLKSLEQHLAKPPPEMTVRISIIEQIRTAIEAVHKRGIVHCNLKPSAIVWSADGTWKLVNFDYAEFSEKPLRQNPKASLQYMPPELMSAERNLPVDTSFDHWAVGVIGYELFTGKQLYGEAKTKEQIVPQLQNILLRQDLPEISSSAARKLIYLLLSLEKHELPSTALPSSGSLSHTSSANRSLHPSLSTKRIAEKTNAEVTRSNIEVMMIVEEFAKTDSESPFGERLAYVAVDMNDFSVTKQPIYVLNVEKAYRLRVTVRHTQTDSTELGEISAVFLQPWGEERLRLDIVASKRKTNDLEVLAYYDPTNSTQHSAELKRVCKASGERDHKYVQLDVHVHLTKGPNKKMTVYWKTVSSTNKLFFKRISCKAKRLWNRSPKHVQDIVKGTALLLPTALFSVGRAAAGDPTAVLTGLHGLFTLDCCQPDHLPNEEG